MWTRRELKEKARASLKMNYWKTVLVSLLILAIGGGVSAAVGSGGASSQDSHATSTATTIYVDEDMNPEELAQLLDDMDGLVVSTGSPEEALVPDGVPVPEDVPDVLFSPIVLFTVLAGVGLIVLVGLAIVVVVDVFVINPFVVGARRFFTRNLNQQAEVKEVAYAFDSNNYREIARTMFWRELYIFLWGLLLIVPGVIKAYQYRLVPYLLADDPTMDKDRALAESTRLMEGNKWKAFVLDLSFLGWHILSALTLGILEIFYVAPYQSMTDAALYESLCYGGAAPAPGIPAASPTAPQVPVPPFAAVGAPVPAWDDESNAPQVDGPVVPGSTEA